MIVLSIATGGFLINKLWTKWSQSPVIVSFAETSTPVWQIPFPAVTICSETKILQSKFSTITAFHPRPTKNTPEDELLKRSSVVHICENDLFSSSSYNFTDISVDFLKEVSPNNSMFNECKWKRKEINCKKNLVPVTTDNGFCYSFNLLDSHDLFRENVVQYDEYTIKERRKINGWNSETGYFANASLKTYPERGLSPNVGAGLSILVTINNEDLDYLCAGTMQGLRISIHSPADFPKMSQQFFMLPLKQELIVTIKPNMITTSAGLRAYDSNRRQCFMADEKKLMYFKIYSQKNCEWECLSNYTKEICDCVPFWMPRDNNTNVCTTDKMDCIELANDNIERLEIKYVLAQKRGGHLKSRKMRNEINQCNCMPSCTSISYDAEVSQIDLDVQNILNAIGDKENLAQNVSMSKISLFFKEAQFIPSKRSELYGITDFLANCGGILGLFLGFSILSLIEIIYFSTIRPLFNYMHEDAAKKKRMPKLYVD